MGNGRYPRVLAVTRDFENPCDHYRVVAPFRALRQAGYDVDVLPIGIATRHWCDTEVLVLPRAGVKEDWAFLAVLQALRARGIAYIWEADDDLLHVPPEHERSETFNDPAAQDGFRQAIAGADAVTVSTPYLASQLRPLNDRMHVLPNLIDPTDWTAARKVERRMKGLTVGVQGSRSHQHDWEVLRQLVPILADRYPFVTFVVAGYLPDYLEALNLGERLVHVPWVPLAEHPSVVGQIDVALAPLRGDWEFNKSKSPIKAMESWMCGAPVVASPTVYETVVRESGGGFVARGLDQWVRATSRLIEDGRLRRTMGGKGRRYVERELNATDPRHQRTRMEVYRQAWERASRRGER